MNTLTNSDQTTKYLKAQISTVVKQLVHQVIKINDENSAFTVHFEIVGSARAIYLYCENGEDFVYLSKNSFYPSVRIYLDPLVPKSTATELNEQFLAIQTSIAQLQASLVEAHNDFKKQTKKVNKAGAA